MKTREIQEKLFHSRTIPRRQADAEDIYSSPGRKLPINTPNSARIIRKVFTENPPSGQPIDGNKILTIRRSVEIKPETKR